MKYILTSGCSFTNNVRYDRNNKKVNNQLGFRGIKIKSYYLQQEVGDDYEVWNLGGLAKLMIMLVSLEFLYTKLKNY